MSHHLERGMLLLQQGKSELAEKELRAACAELPQLGVPHAILALCLLDQEKLDEAQAEAETAIHLSPDQSLGHSVLARVLCVRQRIPQARESIQRAIEIDPHEEDCWGVLAMIELSASRWKEALAAADQGLAIDPEDESCAHARSVALIKLGRTEEAQSETARALQQNPDDAAAHADRGWALLETGRYREAQHHFREALRLEPEMEWARQGMVTALKARNPIYRWILNYFLWMSKFSSRAQWGLVLGFFVLYQIARSVMRQNETLRPFLLVLVVGYTGFVLMTWLTDPLFNLLLRLNRFGRYVLSDDQRRGADLLAICLLVAVVGFVSVFVTLHTASVLTTFAALLLLIPVSVIYRCDRGWPRTFMAGVAGLLAVLAVVAVGADIAGRDGLVTAVASPFLIGVLATFWLGNFLISVEVRR